MAWLPQARPEQIRRLQIHAQSCDAPVFLLRPITALNDASPAPLRVTVQSQIEHELALICELRYEHYFLTVYDIVAFARSRHILCQGRGSAANSVVCYYLGVTEVDPARMSVLAAQRGTDDRASVVDHVSHADEPRS